MRTMTIELFTFDELNPKAKQRAIENWRDSETEFDWADEWRDSLKAFCSATGIKAADWEVSLYSHSYVRWNDWLDNCTAAELAGLRLRTWLINNWLPSFEKGKYYSTAGKWTNGKYSYTHRHSRCQFEADNCPLTGFCGDMALIDPILKFIKSPDEQTSLASLIDDCFDQWIKEQIADMEFQQSDEYIIDAIRCNEYEFTADGHLA